MLKLHSDVLEARTPGEIREAFATMVKRRPEAAIVLADPMFVREASYLVQLAAEQRRPVMYGLREVVVAGGLMSYGASFTDLFRRAATYVDKILRGSAPQRSPGRAGIEVRTRHQSQDRQGAGADDPAIATGAGGRAHPMIQFTVERASRNDLKSLEQPSMHAHVLSGVELSFLL